MKELTLREKLDIIDGWLCDTTGNDARKLSNILSALRGPDNDNDDITRHVKDSSTNVIRREAFPLAWGRAGGVPWSPGNDRQSMAGWDTSDTAEKFVSPRDNGGLREDQKNYIERHNGCGWHFMQHVEQAAEALGLIKRE